MLMCFELNPSNFRERKKKSNRSLIDLMENDLTTFFFFNGNAKPTCNTLVAQFECQTAGDS